MELMEGVWEQFAPQGEFSFSHGTIKAGVKVWVSLKAQGKRCPLKQKVCVTSLHPGADVAQLFRGYQPCSA